jgi:hypothetical protein
MQAGRPRLLLIGIMMAMTLFLGCGEDSGGSGRSGRGDSSAGNSGGDVSVRISVGEAKDIVQRYVLRQGGTVTVQVPFTTTRQEKVSCSPQEVGSVRSAHPSNPELWKCRPCAPGSERYCKNVPVQTKKCCKAKIVRLPSQVSWDANYSRSNDSWGVTVEFDVDDISQLISWDVDDDTGRISPR